MLAVEGAVQVKAKFAVVIVAVGLVGAPVVMAHHSFAAEYDANRPVTLKGVVTKIEWTNPHAHMFVDVQDDKGSVNHWKFELAGPKVLVQCGWRATSINIGDIVTIDGAMAKDGSLAANARVVTLPDGRSLSAGSSGGDLPPR
jgi:hypothetical protein